jgi:hypothetical protein
LIVRRPILEGHGPQRCVIDAINAARTEDDVPSDIKAGATALSVKQAAISISSN